MRYKKVLPGNTSYSGITQSEKKVYIFGTSMVSNAKAKKLNNKLRGASARIRDFGGATIKHLKHHVLLRLVDDISNIAVIHGECNDLGASGRIRHFGGATIKHLKHHVLLSLVDDICIIAVIHGECNDFGYKNKEALSTDDIVNAILETGRLCQSQGANDIFISSLICRKNNF